MKIFLRLSAVTLSLGMLGASACSSCDKPKETPVDPAINGVQSYNCGPGTRLVGTQCVGTSSTGGASSTGGSTTLGTTGNN